MYNVVVSGANSFIGMSLINQLSQRGYNVYALVRNQTDRSTILSKFNHVKIVYYSLDRIEDIADQIPYGCDIFVHLAWRGIRGWERDNGQLQKNNGKWAVRTLETAVALGCNIFMEAGSQAEYGITGNSLITEQMPCNPVTEYGKRKYEFYQYLTAHAETYGLRVLEPRFFSLYGPYDYENTLIMSLLKKFNDNLECPLTPGIQWWDFLYISDAVNAMIKLLENGNCQGAFNIAYGESQPLKHFIEQMRNILAAKSRLCFGAVPYPLEGKIDLRVSIDTICNQTRWKPEITFQEGIKLTQKYLYSERAGT